MNTVPFLLFHSSVDTDGREVAIHKEFVQLGSPFYARNKNDALVELKSIKQIHQLSGFLGLLQLHIILLQTVQCEFAAIVDVDFERLCKV